MLLYVQANISPHLPLGDVQYLLPLNDHSVVLCWNRAESFTTKWIATDSDDVSLIDDVTILALAQNGSLEVPERTL